MCRQVKCKKCGKATWAGCGQHIEQALAGVSAQNRCQCSTTKTQTATGPGLLARLFKK